MRALICRQRQVGAVRQPHDAHLDALPAHRFVSGERGGDALDQRARHVIFRLRRPGFDAVRGDQMNRVGVAAHDAGLRRNVVGENPVAAFFGELRLGIGDDVIGLGGKADDEARPAGFAMRDGRQDIGILDQLERRRAALLLLDFAFARPVRARQSATAAANTATSAGSAFSTAASICRAVSTCTTDDAGRIGQLTGPLTNTTSAPAAAAAAAMAWPCLPDERLAMKRTGSIGSLVGPDVTSTRLPVSGSPPCAGSPQQRRRFRAARPCGRCRLRRARPSRRHSGRRSECRRPQAAPDCAASPWPPTCAGSSPAQSGSACRLQATRRWRDRRRGRPPFSRSGRRSPARRRRDRCRAPGEYGRHRIRSADRTGRYRRVRREARRPRAA